MQRKFNVVIAAAAAAAATIAVLAIACEADPPPPPPTTGDPSTTATPTTAATPTANATPVKIMIAYGSEKKSWLEAQNAAFLATNPKTKSGRAIQIESKAMGSGDAATSILDGTMKPTVFSPASSAYVALLNQQWLSKPGNTKALAPAGDAVVLSPIVIAMWKPMAEALGWPKKQLGWSDLLKVNGNPKGWGGYGHPEWGAFKLGHTQPLYSNSGLQAIVAVAYAGAKKQRGFVAADVDSKNVAKLLGDVESTIVHYGKSTGFFADAMNDHGPSYLSASVLYENLVVESYAKQKPGNPPLVAVYPVEGTFWSDHPYSILHAPWVGADERDAAEQLLAFLKAKPAQEAALALGFRPADPAIAVGAPIDADHGVDAKQPQTLLDTPDGATLQKLLDLWQSLKKPANVVLVMDVSGSMQGKPLEEAKAGAKAFLDVLHDRDEVTLLFFSTQVMPPLGPFTLKDGKQKLAAAIDGAIAQGNTALYDATSAAYTLASTNAKKEKGRIQAVVVMTDGADSAKGLTLDALKKELGANLEEGANGGGAGGVHVFTIAFGEQAQEPILQEIAKSAGGAEAKGKVGDIVGVFRDTASFF